MGRFGCQKGEFSRSETHILSESCSYSSALARLCLAVVHTFQGAQVLLQPCELFGVVHFFPSARYRFDRSRDGFSASVREGSERTRTSWWWPRPATVLAQSPSCGRTTVPRNPPLQPVDKLAAVPAPVDNGWGLSAVRSSLLLIDFD
jgi:hypothetical protein